MCEIHEPPRRQSKGAECRTEPRRDWQHDPRKTKCPPTDQKWAIDEPSEQKWRMPQVCGTAKALLPVFDPNLAWVVGHLPGLLKKGPSLSGNGRVGKHDLLRTLRGRMLWLPAGFPMVARRQETKQSPRAGCNYGDLPQARNSVRRFGLHKISLG